MNRASVHLRVPSSEVRGKVESVLLRTARSARENHVAEARVDAKKAKQGQGGIQEG